MNDLPTYSVGVIGNPQPNDPRFRTSLQAALDWAVLASEQAYKALQDETVLAVWQDDNGGIMALVHIGVVYKPS